MTAWRNRPLDAVYSVVFIEAIVVKVRDSRCNKPMYVMVVVTVIEKRDTLGLWAETAARVRRSDSCRVLTD